jgi:hypothetical protein
VPALALAGLLMGIGCSVQPRSFPLAPDAGADATRLMVRGDWNDVDVGVQHGVSAGGGQMTILTRPQPAASTDPDAHSTLRYELLGIDDTPGEVSATWLDAPPAHPAPTAQASSALATIELRVRVGALGQWRDQAREQRIIQAIARRIRQLAGVKTAPLDARERS